MNAGEMRYRVILQKRSSTTGTRGQLSGEWSDVGGSWAKVEHLSGRELEQARQIVETVSTRFTIRKPEAFDANSKYRVAFRGEFYNVESALPMGERLEVMELLCGVAK